MGAPQIVHLSAQLMTPSWKMTGSHTWRNMVIKQLNAPFANDMFFQYVQMRGSLEIIHFLLSCKGKWKANYGCISTCLHGSYPTELICHPQSYWWLALSLSLCTYQVEMIKDLISLRGHLSWGCHPCNLEVISSTRENKRTMASLSISTMGREVMECLIWKELRPAYALWFFRRGNWGPDRLQRLIKLSLLMCSSIETKS